MHPNNPVDMQSKVGNEMQALHGINCDRSVKSRH